MIVVVLVVVGVVVVVAGIVLVVIVIVIVIVVVVVVVWVMIEFLTGWSFGACENRWTVHEYSLSSVCDVSRCLGEVWDGVYVPLDVCRRRIRPVELYCFLTDGP